MFISSPFEKEGVSTCRALNIREYALGGVSPSGRVLGDVLAECLTPTVTQLRILSCGLRHLPPALLALPQVSIINVLCCIYIYNIINMKFPKCLPLICVT